MSKEPKEYRRLPGRHKNFFGGLSTLWQGKDHLLAVSYSFGIERYKRFYYQDIQAFIIRKTSLGRIQNIIVTVIALSFGLLMFSSGRIGTAIFGILTAVMVMILLFNIWRGPTCEFLIQTAVQQEKMKNFYRLKTAFKALELIKPLVQNAQGYLSAGALHAGWRAATLPTKTFNRPTAAAVENRSLNFHLVYFSILLLHGLVSAVTFFRQHLVISAAETIFGLGAAALVIPALVRQHQAGMAKNIRVLTWVSLGYMAVNFLCGYAVYLFIAFKHPMAIHDQWQMFRLAAQLSPSSHPLLFGINMYVSAGALILGLGGLLMLRRP